MQIHPKGSGGPPRTIEVRPGDRFGGRTVIAKVEAVDGRRRMRVRRTRGRTLRGALPPAVAGGPTAAIGEVPAPMNGVDAYPWISLPRCAILPPEEAMSNPPAAVQPSRPHATVPVPHVKLTVALRPEQLPRDVLPREGAQAVPIDLVFSIAAEVGRPALHIRATLNGGNATVLIQGRLSGNRELLDAGITVQPKVSTGDRSSPEVGRVPSEGPREP